MQVNHPTGQNGNNMLKAQLMDELKKKSDELMELQYAKGYATALMEFLKMVSHLKGHNNDATITIGEISQLAQIAMESLPMYQEFKKAQGI